MQLSEKPGSWRLLMNFKIRRLLIAVTDDTARRVVDRAAQLVGSSKARVELFSVVRPPPRVLGMTRIDDPLIARSMVEAKRQQLEKLARQLRDKGVDVTSTVVAHASVVDAIVRRAKQSKADIVAIEAHQHTILARLFLSQNDYDLIRHCPVPLLIVKGGKSKPSAPILAALDPWHSIRNPQVLDDAIALAGRGIAVSLGTTLLSVHVYSPLMGFAADSAFAPMAIPISLPAEKQHAADIRRAFAKVNARYRIDKARSHLRMGDPAFILPALAKSLKIQMLVMGAISRSAVGRLLIGSTAERVLDAMPCDVLIVKPMRRRVSR
jgi:universal stress protein E